MRFNTLFEITKNKKTEKKFEVLDIDNNSHHQYHSIVKKELDEKYKGYKVDILKVTPSTTAIAGIV